MPRVLHKAFAGMRPGREPELLAPGEAQLAINTRLNDGSIESVRGLSAAVTTLASAGTVRTIYRFGQSLSSDTQYWLESANDADFVRGPVADDTTERTYYTGIGYPRKTNAALATGAAPLPTNSYRMGVVRPGGVAGVPETPSSFVPVCTVTGTAGSSPLTYSSVYIVTYVSAWGEESAPSAPSAVVTWQTGQAVTVTLPSAPTGNYNVTQLRLYRANTGTEATQYQFVTELSVSTTTYSDSTTTDQLGEVLGSTSFHEPDDAMVGLTVLPNGGMAGFFENQLCFSEPGYPHAWPIRYRRSMAAPIIAICAFDNTVVVFTTAGTYTLYGTEPANMVEGAAVIPYTCMSKRSVQRLGTGVAFAAAEGLMYVSAAGVENATAAIMATEDWAAYAPGSISGYTYKDTYVGFFDTGTRQAGFVLRIGQNASFTETDVYATAGYYEKRNSTLYLVTAGNQVKKWEGGGLATSTWRSGVARFDSTQSMIAARVEAETYPVTFKFYADGVLRRTKVVNDDSVFRLSSDRRHRRFFYELTFSGVVRAVGYASSVDELKDRS